MLGFAVLSSSAQVNIEIDLYNSEVSNVWESLFASHLFASRAMLREVDNTILVYTDRVYFQLTR